MPHQPHAAAVLDGKIYSLGVNMRLQVYDPASEP
jgi:hypothetical protein